MHGVFYLYQWLKRVSPPHNLTPIVFPRLQGVKITDLKFSCQGFSDSLVTVDEFPDITGIPLSLSTSPFITHHETFPFHPRNRTSKCRGLNPFPRELHHWFNPWATKLSRNDWFQSCYRLSCLERKIDVYLLKMVLERVFYWSWSCGCSSCSSEISLNLFIFISVFRIFIFTANLMLFQSLESASFVETSTPKPHCCHLCKNVKLKI